MRRNSTERLFHINGPSSRAALCQVARQHRGPVWHAMMVDLHCPGLTHWSHRMHMCQVNIMWSCGWCPSRMSFIKLIFTPHKSHATTWSNDNDQVYRLPIDGLVQDCSIDGLVLNCSNSSVLALELLQSCTKPSIDICLSRLQSSQWVKSRLSALELLQSCSKPSIYASAGFNQASESSPGCQQWSYCSLALSHQYMPNYASIKPVSQVQDNISGISLIWWLI